MQQSDRYTAETIHSFERYLTLEPGSDRRAAVEDRIRDGKEKL